MTFEVGKLDRRIELQEPIETRDTTGDVITTYSTVYTVPCAVENFKSAERFSSEQIRSSRVRDFRMRYLTNIEENWQIRYEGSDFRILAIDEIGRREGLKITAEALE